jgi:RND family efflux transporter MFP subunit
MNLRFVCNSFAVSLFALTISACSSDQPATPVATPPKPVLLVEATPADAGHASHIGEVRATQRAELSFAVPGRVGAVLVDMGDTVRAGQALARLDAAALQAQLASATAEVERARIAVVELKQRSERMAPLAASGVAVPAEWDALRAQIDAAEQAVKSARGQRDAAAWQLEQGTLRAPFDAVIASRLLEVGHAAGPGQPVLLLDGRGRQVVVQVPGSIAARTRKGQVVELEYGGKGVRASIIQVAERANPGGTVRVLVHAPANARPGDTLNVRFPSEINQTTHQAVELPLRAVLPDGETGSGRVLQYNVSSGKAETKQVKLGAIRGERIVVIAGLNAGDRVVAAGVSFVAPGSTVQPLNLQP